MAENALIVHFDRGYQSKIGAAGFLLWVPDGKCITGKGICYQDVHVKMTYKVAEVWAARDSLAYLQAKGYIQRYNIIVLCHDS